MIDYKRLVLHPFNISLSKRFQKVESTMTWKHFLPLQTLLGLMTNSSRFSSQSYGGHDNLYKVPAFLYMVSLIS